MEALVEDFLQHLRNEKGQSENTQRTYSALLAKFVSWAKRQNLFDWKEVKISDLIAFLQHERERPADADEKRSARRLSSESIYLQIAALRAFFRYAEAEKIVPLNMAENLSLPRRWMRVPKALNSPEIEKLL